MATLKNKSATHQTCVHILSNLAHDIRSPISSLMAVVKHASDIPPYYCTLIKNTLGRMTDIVDSSLQQVGDNHGDKSPGATQEVSITEIIENIMCEKRYEYKEARLEFHPNLSEKGKLVKVVINPSDFARMISNLFNNAVEAMSGQDFPVIALYTLINGQNIDISITDYGKGMPDEVINKIMRNEPVTYGKACGQGIGFQQITNTITNYGGTLDIKSKPGQGTQIKISFPYVYEPANQSATIIKPRKATSKKPVSNKSKIKQSVDMVFVDDDEDMVNVFKDTLFKSKNVDTYRSPEDFLMKVDMYTTNTKIVIDNHFKISSLTGFDVLKNLHERGFDRIYLYSGSDFKSVPSYINKVIGKTDVDSLIDLINAE